MKIKRIFCAVLAFLLLSFSLTACTPDKENSETSSTEPAVTTALTEVTDDEATETGTDFDDPDIKPDHLTIGGVDISEYTVVIPVSPGSYDQIAADHDDRC